MAEHDPDSKVMTSSLVVVGLIIVGVSLACLIGVTNVDEHDEVECGGQVMETDETCIVWTNGSSSEHSYAEMEASNGQKDWIPVIFAVIGMIFGVLLIAVVLYAHSLNPPPTHDRAPQGLSRTPMGGAPASHGKTPRSTAEPVKTHPKPKPPEPPPPPKPPDPARTVTICNVGEGIEIAATLAGLAVKELLQTEDGPKSWETLLHLPWYEIAELEFDRAGDDPAVLYALRMDGGPRERIVEADLFPLRSWSRLGRAIEEKTAARLRIDAAGDDGTVGHR